MLRTRLYLGLLPLLLLFIVVGVTAMILCRDLAQLVERNVAANYRAMLASYEMRDAARSMITALGDPRAGDDTAARQNYLAERSRFRRQLMDQTLASAGTSRTPALEQLGTAFAALDDLASARLAGTVDRTPAILAEIETRLFGTLQLIEQLTQQDYADVQSAAARANRLARVSVNFLATAMVGATLLSLYLSYRLARALLRPIQALTTSAVALGEGRLDHDVPVTSADELGELARTFNRMAGSLRAYRDAMNERVMRARLTMEATLTSAPDPLFIVSRDGAREVLNPAAHALATTPEFADGFPPAVADPLARVLATGEHSLPADFSSAIGLRVDDEERFFLPRILAVGDRLSGFGGAAVILQDVTKFRLLDDVKNNLVATVSHELKTPLTSLRMAVYLLLEQSFGPLTAKQADLVEGARDDAERLLRILNDLLDLSRLERGASSLNRRDIPAQALLDDMAREMKAIAEAARQTIAIELAPALTTVHVDPERIRHVFINLLANASKYSPDATVITLYARPADDGFLRFGVRDQGPGIPAESVPEIFEKFYRVPGQEKKGAGLGLTIAREIVVAHGGSIGCTSTEGAGSDFWFLLPAAA